MTFISTAGQSLEQTERIKLVQSQLSTLQYQLSSGKKTRLFKGLETGVITSERARADFKSIETYIGNITIADRRIKLMDSTIATVQQQAENVLNALEIQTQSGEFELGTIGDLAANSFDFILSLMNEQDGDRYLFGGAGTRDQPVRDTGSLDSYLATRINQWVTTGIDTDELVDSYRDTAQLNDTVVGYSAVLSSGKSKSIFVRVDEKTELDYTVKANESGFRDILVAIGAIKNLTQSLDEVTREADDPAATVTAPGATKQEQNENFYQVFNDLARMLTTGIDSLVNERFSLSQVQAQMNQIQENYKIEKNVLSGIISDVEDVDLNETAVKLNSLQIQLEASFRVTASLSDLSLVNFI
ncbi:MAG: hypothetical protein KDJ15_04325 [Alphaproteobacteria bacterium]|nr:hypothetical protein [Alphaproteobacteria bacterium]